MMPLLFDRPALVGAAIGTMSWGVGYVVTQILAQGLSSVSAYALLSGWWLTAYTASVFRVTTKAAIPLAMLFLVLFLLAALGGQTWFYRDVSSLTLLSMLGIGAVQAVVTASPILFNSAFHKVTGCG